MVDRERYGDPEWLGIGGRKRDFERLGPWAYVIIHL